MKIVILDGYCVNPGDLDWLPLEALGALRVYDRTPLHDDAEILRRITDAEAVFTNKTPLRRAVIEACPQLRFIGILATGYNIVDTAAAAARGIPVCNIPGYSTATVAQLTFALLLDICNHAAHHSQQVHAGRWCKSEDFCFWDGDLIELSGKTLGIIGFGSIGQAVARIARAFGMHVLAYSRTQRPEAMALADYVPLNELLARSDVVSLHCPLTAENTGLINRETISQMKPGAILLNTARGALVDEQALAEALNDGRLYMAGVDVISAEPMVEDNPLLHAKNCLITPHIAWVSDQSRRRLIEAAAQNLRAFCAGNPLNVVNGVF